MIFVFQPLFWNCIEAKIPRGNDIKGGKN